MKYLLMHKNIPVAEVELTGRNSAITNVYKLFEPKHLPVGINADKIKTNELADDLNDWFSVRSIPASRQNLKEVMERLKITSPKALIAHCFGLSLSDHYWINPVDNPLDWNKINFFDNAFSEDVGNILFGDREEAKELNLLSPDNSSDGWLKKKWKIIDGDRYLIKGGSFPNQQEPLNETISYMVSERINVDCVAYSNLWENNMPYSVCKNFLSNETELVCACYLMNAVRVGSSTPFQHFLNCCSKLNIQDAENNINRMLVLDFLIANTDRHPSNFGAVRNAETLEWVGISPIFDNGTSLWHDRNNIEDNVVSKPFAFSHNKQIELVTDFSWLDLSKLNGIETEIYNVFKTSPYIDDYRIEMICGAFEKRVKMLEQYVQRRENPVFAFAVQPSLEPKKMPTLKELKATATAAYEAKKQEKPTVPTNEIPVKKDKYNR